MTYDGLDEAALGEVTRAPLVRMFDSVPSVLDVAHVLGAEGAPSGAIVLADTQTRGRGRSGRVWHSPPGAGIWLGVLLRPAEPPAGGSLSIRAGTALAETLAITVPQLGPVLKWPNDLYINDRKLGGILCEARWVGERLSWVTIGIGLNVHGPLPPELDGSAIAIADVTESASRLEILSALVPMIMAFAGAPPLLSEAERKAYVDHLWLPEGTPPFVRLDPDGALVVRLPDGSLDRRIAPP